MRHQSILISFSVICFSILSTGCAVFTQSYLIKGLAVDKAETAIVTKDDYFGDSAERIVYPEQNWSDHRSLWFYNTSQGSDLLPYDIMLNLEQSDSQTKFLDNKNIEKFRYLPQKPTKANKDGLPVGWVKDTYKNEEYVGFTCAACHTNQINYKGVGIRVDGAPTMADMEGMLLSLEDSLHESLETTNADKFKRLLKSVGKDNNPEETALFSKLLIKTHKDIKFYNKANKPTHNNEDLPYGYGRLDAIGRIYNRTLLHLGGKDSNGNLI